MTEAQVHRELGLTDDEAGRIETILGRPPSYTELAMFSVMWSEHCSYKSSRQYLKTLPSSGPRILVGPGEGAGIIEVAPGLAVAWKIESHNHPSFVEPFQGAATGVGGIVRDILSMGARPIALLDSLRFGPPDDARKRLLVEGVVHGISSYGNSIGVPTVGGEAIFDPCYAENPLVNVACLGVVEGKLMQGRAATPGHSVILFGSPTGRDGIGGASVLASATFEEGSEDKRPAVQVGDPFTEKLLIEASLELIDRDLVAGFQDLGAGGVTCPISEMCAKSGTGMRIDAGQIHLRAPDMEPWEIMISESQERMLAVVAPGNVDAVLEVCTRWGLIAVVLGEVTAEPLLEVFIDGERVAEVPPEALAEGPVYDRPASPPIDLEARWAAPVGADAPADAARALLSIAESPSIASKRWIWQQYDHMIFLGTVLGPGSDAAVIRLPGREEGVAITVDGPGRYCALDPYEGARLAVAEAARNVACSGAMPAAVTNCLNFGSPEVPEVMWSFAESVRGIADACSALETPVTGGNVSFYNETSGRPIHPTPAIGMLGIIEDAASARPSGWVQDGHAVHLLGTTGDDLGGSEFAAVINGITAGRPPALDLDAEKRLIDLLCSEEARVLLASAHDISSGGLATAALEASVLSGRGCTLRLGGDLATHIELFSETPSRALVSCDEARSPELEALARSRGVPCQKLGLVGGDRIDLGVCSVTVEEARGSFEGGLERALSATMN